VELDITFFALTIPAVIFASVSKAGFGSGAAFAATPILALILPPAQAIGLMLPLLMLVDVAALRAYWRLWNWRIARWLLLGAPLGIVVGALLYKITDPNLFRLFIGIIALGFVGYRLVMRLHWISARERPFPPAGGVLAGSVAGFTSFISHAGGPPVSVYLLAEGMGKTTFQATTVLTFWVINGLKFAPYAWLGIFTRDSLVADLYLAPFALIGAWLGVRAHHMVPERVFFGLTYVMLTLTGAKLIWDALS